MAWNNSQILLIDPDEAAARELTELLRNRTDPPKVWVAGSVASAEMILRSQPIEWLFIRIILWDDYQRLRPTLVAAPRSVVFLSGRNEKCTLHLSLALDGHLQPPYRSGHLVRIWNRWMGAGFAATIAVLAAINDVADHLGTWAWLWIKAIQLRGKHTRRTVPNAIPV